MQGNPASEEESGFGIDFDTSFANDRQGIVSICSESGTGEICCDPAGSRDTKTDNGYSIA